MSLLGEIQKLSLNQPLASSSPADLEDVTAVKARLKRDGYYEEPSYGMTPYPDTPLFEGIKKFQRDNGLTVDGVMNPDGETERAMNKIILASDFETPEIPKEKSQYFTDDLKKKRENFSRNLNKIDVGEREFKSIMTTYDFEGGDAPDGKSISGLTPSTLQDLNKRYDMKLPDNATAKDLSPEERAQLLINHGDFSFERIGGRSAYDNFPDEHAAKTILDTTVRHGASGGAILVRKALNATKKNNEPALDEGPGRIGQQTLDRLNSISKDAARRKAFYDALADERSKEYPNEKARFDHFRVNE